MSATIDVPPTEPDRPGHAHCVLCGREDPLSLGLHFEKDEAGVVRAQFQAHAGLQGYDGILHGGVISALLDAAMWHCLLHHGITAYTGDLHVRFKKPVPLSALLELKAQIVLARPPLYRTVAELMFKNLVMAKAEGAFMRFTGR